MAKLILDGTHKLIAAHAWGEGVSTHCPIEIPSGGSAIDIDKEGIDLLLSLMIGGQSIVIEESAVKVDGEQIGIITDGKLELL